MTLHRSSTVQPNPHRAGRLASLLITVVAIAIALGSSSAVLASDHHLTARDSDGDGLPDLVELQLYRTNPLHPDSDRDGLGDGDEVVVHHTNPLDADTDGDGVSDGDEVRLGTNPSLDEHEGVELAGLQTTPSRARAFSIAHDNQIGTAGRLPTTSISAPENRSLREVEVAPGTTVSRVPVFTVPAGLD
jgi:hypothetical protein